MIRRLAIGIVVVATLSGAALADRFTPAPDRLPPTDRASAPGGAWACPVVKGAGTGGWLHLVNAGTGASRVRITYVPDGAKSVEQSITLQPHRAATVATP